MRGTRKSLRWLGVVLLVIAGCHTEPPLKPNIPAEYKLPPETDARYSSPPNYPKETLDTEQFKKDQGKPVGSSTDSTRFGGPGMGSSGGSRGMGGGGY